MKLVGIDHELSIDTQAAQSLIHLLAALHRYIEVTLAAEKQRRRLNSISVQERIGDLDVGFPGPGVPGRANLIVVLNDVLIGAVESDGECSPGPAGGGFEPIVRGNDVIGKNAAVAPAAHTQAIGISDTHGNHVVHAGEQVLHFVIAPVGKDRARKFLAPARAAPIVHRQYCIAVRGEHLPLSGKGMLILAIRAAMNPQQQRDPGAFRVTGRIGQQPMSFRPVLALKINFFRLAQLQLTQQRIVLMTYLPQRLALHRVNLRGL